MTTQLYVTWETPYLPAVAGLTVEAWPASDFAHSPVGHPGAYPPAPSPAATTTTDSSGNCELTGLTAGVDYYISIIDQNNQPWFQFCPQGYLGNLSTSRRRWSINQGPTTTPAAAVQLSPAFINIGVPTATAGTGAFQIIKWDNVALQDNCTYDASTGHLNVNVAGFYRVSFDLTVNDTATVGTAQLIEQAIVTTSPFTYDRTWNEVCPVAVTSPGATAYPHRASMVFLNVGQDIFIEVNFPTTATLKSGQFSVIFEHA